MRQLFLCAIQITARQFFILRNLFKRYKGQHLHAFDDIGIVHIAPILEKVIGRRFVRIQPNRVSGGFAHFISLRIGQQRDGHGIGVLAELPADEFRTAEHVAPLIVAAELHVAAVFLVQDIEIVALHNHVVKF